MSSSSIRENNDAQLNSPSFRLPALDQEFLLDDSTRGIRFQLEYAKAQEAHLVMSGMLAYEELQIFEFANDAASAWATLELHSLSFPHAFSSSEQRRKPVTR
jgi:hypothetical protein